MLKRYRDTDRVFHDDAIFLERMPCDCEVPRRLRGSG